MKLRAIKKLQWDVIIVFSITLLGSLFIPFYIYTNGISLSEILIFFLLYAVTGLSITVGYHRLYAHSTFKAHPVVEFLVLFFGAAALEQSAIRWSAQHRLHHQFVDTDQDPYNIEKGFFYAHMGWLMFWRFDTPLDNVKDLKRSKLVLHQHKYFPYWALGTGVIFPLILGALTGHLLGAFLINVCLRIAFVHHSTFSINSICHTFGKATYDIYSSAKDHWLVALITNGEGYHNFHHRFPTDYRNGVRWYHWDPSKWVIALLAKIGLAKDLRRVSRFVILDARLKADKQRLNDQIVTLPDADKVLEKVKEQYILLKEHLEKWDHALREYREVLEENFHHSSDEIKKSALKKVKSARAQFTHFYSKWSEFTELHPVELQRNFQSGLL